METIAMICAVAVLGDGVPAGIAARLAGLGLDDGERVADRLAACGLLAHGRPLRFADPAIRALVYASMTPGARAIAHRRAVRVLTDADASPSALAQHACAVEPAGDPAVARALVAAGRSAQATGAARQAAVLLERALAEPPLPAQRPEARLLLGRALARLGDRRAPALLGGQPELVDALWLTGDAAGALTALGDEPPGVRAARSARDGSLPAAQIVPAAKAGVDGETAFERCCALAALIACDELDSARRALTRSAQTAFARGASAELAILQLLRSRLRAVEGTESAGATTFAGPDPGPAPWTAHATQRFGTPSALAATADGDRAVALLRDSPRRGDLARALLALGRSQRHAGRRRDARATLTEALALAQRLGDAALTSAAQEELKVAGARPRRECLSGPGSLTAAERRVADAAATGSTNNQIARDLFLSRKTVEMHLGRVYRKLDIASRADLPHPHWRRSGPDGHILTAVMPEITPALYRAGEGDPLVLVHGFTASWPCWRPVLPELVAQFDVFAPSLHGHDGGPPPPDGAAHTITEAGDHFEKLLDEQGIDTAHFAGNSMGGAIALEMAKRGRARSVVALSPGGGWEEHDTAEPERIIKWFAFQRKLNTRTARYTQWIMKSPTRRRLALRDVMTRGDQVTAKEAVALARASARCTVIDDVFATIRAGAGRIVDLDRISCPVLVAWGEKDRILPLDKHAPRFRREIPGVQFRGLPGLGHTPMWDDPQGIAALIGDFAAAAQAREPATATGTR